MCFCLMKYEQIQNSKPKDLICNAHNAVVYYERDFVG